MKFKILYSGTYFMTNLFKVYTFLLLLILASGYSYGQVTYTTSGNCAPNQANYFGTPSCWIKFPDNCAPQAPLIPPVSGTVACPITIVINHPINLATFTIGNRISLQLNVGGNLKTTGNFNLNKGTTASVSLNGGELNIGGTLDIAIGGGSSTGTLNITGSGIGKSIITNAINLRSNSVINIAANGSLIVNGITKYNGNNAKINVTGFFRTSELDIAGGNGLEFNTFGDANVVIDNDLKVSGTSSITFGGNSEIDVGGNVTVAGSASLTVGGTSKVFVCGSVFGSPKVSGGQVNSTCRILPVEYIYIKSEYSKISNSALLSWATTKEWENSRFEIERSVGNISDFEKIGEVSGMGWKETITEYEYVDTKLPLIGGNVYYRLKQVDINGTYSLSKVMSVKVQGVQFTQGVWRAYPNPTNGEQLRVSLLDKNQYNQESISFRIIHPTSISQEIAVPSENDMNEVLARMVGSIPKGVFVVEVRWGQKVEHIKVIKK